MAYFGSASQHADFLINGFWDYSTYGGTDARKWASNTISVNVAGLGDADRALAQTAVTLWADIANLTINYTTGAADITYAAPGGGSTQADCGYSVNSGKISNAVVTIGQSYGGAPRGETFIHETGHALGLGHLGPYNGNMQNSVFTNDTVQYSIMSYGRQNFGTNVGSNIPVDSPAMSDIYAVQLVYGANTTVRNGATTYGFNSNAGATYNFGINTVPNFTIYDTGGTDTINTSGFASAQTINLNAGTWSSIGGYTNNIGIYLTSTIENAIGGTGVDTIHGNAVGNRLEGLAGNDTLYGNDGSDTLLGGAGQDTLNGGNGTDTASYVDSGTAVQASLTLGTGKVTVGGTTVVDTFVSIENLEGSLFDDSLSGNSIANGLYGLGGNDTLDGVGGADYLDGGTGTDTASYTGETAAIDADLAKNATYGKVTTATGEDTLYSVENIVGSNFNDKIKGDAVANVLSGGAGADAIEGRAGNDTLNGGTGNDTLDGGDGTDTVTYVSSAVGVSADLVSNTGKTTSGVLETDTFVSIENLTGSNFNDHLGGNSGANVINGGAGNDTISGGAGVDSLSGGDDTDTVTFASETAAISADLTSGKVTINNVTETILAFENIIGGSAGDSISGTSGDNTITGLAGSDILKGLAGIDTADYSEKTTAVIVTLAGNADATVFVGGVAEDTISGFENVIGGSAGDALTGDVLVNVLIGNGGNDLLDGKAGADTMNGGSGNDSYTVDNIGDIVADGAGLGTADVITTTISLTLAAGLEIETLQLAASTGAAALDLTGNEFVNALIGNSGNNTLDGKVGADTMRGGLGNDIYVVDNVGDKAIETSNEGVDLVNASVSFALTGQAIERLTLTGSADINGTGNSGANTIFGNSGANIIDGGTNADKLGGLGGNDIYYVDDAGDQVFESAGNGTDLVRASVNFSLAGQAIENLTLIGTAAINGTGNSAANVLNGNAANNTLEGAGGSDRLDGQAGADTMRGGTGDDAYYVDNIGDTLVELANEGNDTVNSRVSFSLSGLAIENLTLIGGGAINGAGNSAANTLIGNNAANIIDGGTNADKMYGLDGDDIYVVDNILDQVFEIAANGTDLVRSSVGFSLAGQAIENLTLTGSAAARAIGNSAANTIVGNSGNNVIDGGGNGDVLTGRGGNDSFAFSTTLGGANIDRITDFSVVDDVIRLSESVFGALSLGALAASAFKDLSTGAIDASDRIIYNKTTGAISYDSDGSGAGAAFQFATLDNKVGITQSDFFIV